MSEDLKTDGAAQDEQKPDKTAEPLEPVLVTSKVFSFLWAGIPGSKLTIPLCIALSDDMARQREELATLSIDERNAKNPLYKVEMLADVLDGRPQGFPDFPIYEPNEGEAEEDFLKREFIKYFSRKDSRGRRIFQRFVEDVYNQYWGWVLPNPILPASEFLLSLLATTTQDSES